MIRQMPADDPPTPEVHRRAGRFSIALTYTALLSALLYLLISHSRLDAPMRTHQPESYLLSETERLLRIADQNDPRPAEMDFKIEDRQNVSANLAKLYIRTYYMAQYLRCPNRVYIGTDDQIVNDENQALDASKLPSKEWLKHKGIGSIYHINNMGILGAGVVVEPVK